MAPMPAVKTTAELYPPQCERAFWDFLRGITTGDLDEHGYFVLRRALTQAERQSLTDRQKQLAPWLEPGKRNSVATSIAAMLLGWSGAMKVTSREEANAIAAAYVMFLRPLPSWAIDRACLRFASGQVKPEEVNAKTINHSYPPSSAMVRIVAADLAKPFGDELTRLRLTLGGAPSRVMTPEQKASMDSKVAEHLRRTEAARANDEEVERQLKADRKQVADAERHVLAQYERAGVEPHRNRNGMLVSLSMMLKAGWRVEDVGGRSVLVSPATGRADSKAGAEQ